MPPQVVAVLSIAVLSTALLLLAVSCGSDTSPPESQTEGQGPETTEPPELRIGCPSGPFFPISALDSAPPLIEDSAVPEVADAIAPFLSSGEGDFWPQDGWRVLELVVDQQVELVHPGSAEAPGVAFMSATWNGGQWQWSGSSIPGDCVLVTEAEGGDGSIVEWVVDPDGDPIGPETTTLVLLATERGCASGQPMGDRLREPLVTVTDDAIRILLSTEPREGDQECPGNPSQRVEIELPEPLGDRELLDARDTDLGDLADVLADLIRTAS